MQTLCARERAPWNRGWVPSKINKNVASGKKEHVSENRLDDRFCQIKIGFKALIWKHVKGYLRKGQ